MGSKIDLLKKAVAALPHKTGSSLHIEDLLQDSSAWQSLYIDYEPPFLMRLYLPVCAEGRTLYLSLHYFFGKDDVKGLDNPYTAAKEEFGRESANNYHPHPWASAFHLFDGSYRQEVGLATELGYSADPSSPLRPKPFETREQSAGGNNRYSFNDPLIWHRVLPNEGKPVSTLMLTYKPEDWNQCGPRPPQKQRPLTEQEKDFMFAHFKKILAPQPAPKPKAPARKLGPS